jgi:hypothetical protein
MSWRRATLIALAPAAIVALVLAVNPRIHLRADAMSNSAQAYAVQRHGLPPPDPYLAGEPLYYYWAYNAVCAYVGSALGVDALHVLVWAQPVALAVLLLSTVWLVRELGGSPGGAVLGVALLALGLNGWGWGVLLFRCLAGDATLRAALNEGVNGYLFRVVAGHDKRLAFFLSKTLVATFFVWALAFLPCAYIAARRWLARGSGWAGAAFVASSVAMTYSNLLTGGAWLALVAAKLVLTAVRERGEARRRATIGLGLVALSAAAVVPFVWLTVSPHGREPLVRLALPDGPHLRGFAFGLGPLLICVAILALGRWRASPARDLLWAAAAFALAYVICRLPDGVQLKFIFTAAVLLAGWLGIAASQQRPAVRRMLWLLAASMVPTTALGLVAYTRAPGTVVSPAERKTFAWMAHNTPRDAVVVARWRATLVPVLGRRDLYVPDVVGFHRAARYDEEEWARRQALMRRLDRGEHVAVLQQIEKELGRPVLWVTRTQRVQPNAPRLRRLYASGNLEVWALRDLPPP